jgi:hypothetical protein
MIRRDWVAADGSPHWLLISQVEHARLSGELCRSWSALQTLPTDIREELVAAVFRHDDGWAEWEQAPEVDQTSGRPREFTEMPLAESLEIWSRSIDRSATFGDLAPYMISGHFCALLRRFTHWRKQGPEQVALGETFLNDQPVKQTVWLDRWRAADPTARTVVVANQALAWLQLFDALSLWLCCAQRKEAQEFAPPVGPKFTLKPRSAEEFLVTPWPMAGTSLSLQLTGRCVPAVKYADDQTLAKVTGEPTLLRWDLASR